jgi:hypothetical protein
LKPFIGVRVAEIQATWDPRTWKYVPTKLKVCEMSGRWMNGPAFLREPAEEWPTEANIASPEVPEKKIPKPIFVLQPIPNPIIDPT